VSGGNEGIAYNAAMTAAREPAPEDPFDLVIVGGGAGGVLCAIHALRLATTPARLALVGPEPVLARGVAYATPFAEHLLNVPARRMSAFAASPEDFVDFLVAMEGEPAREALAAGYAQRRHYGDYLRLRLQQARDASPATLAVLHERVESLDVEDDDARLALASGERLRARGVVLALGNSPRPLPARGSAGLAAGTRLEAWDFEAIRLVPADAEVCIAGSGLSMVDTVLSLAGNGHAGPIHVLSRHALLPLPHVAHVASELDTQPLQALDLRRRMRWLREAAREADRAGLPWQATMERVRPQVQALWHTLSLADQRRFLRHAVRYWDVHRHRIAPQVHAELERLRRSGQLRLHRGRLETVAPEGSRIRLSMRMRDRRLQQLDVDRVVNATGVEMRVALMRNPLLSQLLGTGLARPGPHGIGVDTDAEGRLLDAHGHALPQVQVVGSLRIGSLWESIAVPELRGQAESAVRGLLERARI
jgi:uncharacterized NAD(P)/FAD-binding protein YdhS